MRKHYLLAGILTILALFVTSCGAGKKSTETSSEETFVEDTISVPDTDNASQETVAVDTTALSDIELQIESLRTKLLDKSFSLDESVDCEELITEYNDLIEQSKSKLPFKVGVGLVNKIGTKVILLESKDQAESSEYTHCIINGKIYTIAPLQKQEQAAEFDGRQTMRNFDKMEGYLYEITGDKKFSDNDNWYDIHVFFCTEDFISAHTIVPMKYQEERRESHRQYTDEQIRDLGLILTSIKKRYKVGILDFSVKSVSEDDKIRSYTVTVDTKAPMALGLTVVSVDGQLIFGEDFAVRNDISTWRADDEGYYEGHSLNFVFVDKKGNLNLFVSSYGADGPNLFTMYQRGDRLIQHTYMAYFYSAPI